MGDRPVFGVLFSPLAWASSSVGSVFAAKGFACDVCLRRLSGAAVSFFSFAFGDRSVFGRCGMVVVFSGPNA